MAENPKFVDYTNSSKIVPCNVFVQRRLMQLPSAEDRFRMREWVHDRQVDRMVVQHQDIPNQPA